MDRLNEILEIIHNILSLHLIQVGESSVTLFSIFFLIMTFLLLFYFAQKIKNLLSMTILPRYKMDEGACQSVGTITKYLILTIGSFIIFQATGLDLTAFGMVAGALGVGIGFGLQNITNNFISGLIILVERPIKVGDRIEVGEIKGDVVKIAARATTILTNDNISLIVPNAEFISSTVINWSHNDRLVRFSFPVGVSYKEDPKFVRKLVLEVANDNNGVLKKPKPEFLFDGYGDSSINFNLLVWTSTYTTRPLHIKSQLYYAIFKKFIDHGIEIPFPQRDIHLKSSPDMNLETDPL